ncbi:MAG: hypothetical protein IAE85_06945 [Anaerolinea sp.]|nr:hypothetical protein [Anaerolinea sp.]
MSDLRVLDHIARPMQRLGYLKRMTRRVTAMNTSNLENLGHDLIDTVTRKIRVKMNPQRAAYVKVRLMDRAYQTLKEQTNTYLANGVEPPEVSMELQDLYLADPMITSGVGKLVRDDWRKYPALGINLGLIRSGTYSATTRALSLMYLTPELEQKAFLEYLPNSNPLLLSQQQGLLLLYSCLENDGEAVMPLMRQLAAHSGLPNANPSGATFSDRDAGNLLPEIYKAVIARHRTRSLSADLRDRLAVLETSAESIARQRNIEGYSGGTAREHASRVRVEPYVDIGLLTKPDPYRYEYTMSPVGLRWATAFDDIDSSDAIEDFLTKRFFSTAATAWQIPAQPLTDQDEIVAHVQKAWKAINSPGGYAPIEEMGLVAGIEAMLDHGLIIEIAAARQALIDYQRANPYAVRFTVDRMGVLAHARFLEGSAVAP